MNSGIYQIRNLINDDIYIGSSKNLLRRKKDHWRLLIKSLSHNKILQRAWNKYGESSFKFEIIAQCGVEHLFELEQLIVDLLTPKYNISKINVAVPIGVKHQSYYDKTLYYTNAKDRLKTSQNFGWKSQPIEKLDKNGAVIETFPSLKEYAIKHKCSIGNVGKALKKNNKCKGFNIRYKLNKTPPIPCV